MLCQHTIYKCRRVAYGYFGRPRGRSRGGGFTRPQASLRADAEAVPEADQVVLLILPNPDSVLPKIHPASSTAFLNCASFGDGQLIRMPKRHRGQPQDIPVTSSPQAPLPGKTARKTPLEDSEAQISREADSKVDTTAYRWAYAHRIRPSLFFTSSCSC